MTEEGSSDTASNLRRWDTSYCPHFERDGCMIHFSCCEDSRFFPCHRCHNKTIEKENEEILLNQMRSAENHDGDHGDGETSSQADDAQDLGEIPPDVPNTIPTAEEQTQDTPGSTLPVENESQASPPSSPASDEGRPSPAASSLANSEVAVHTAAVNASLAKYDVLHPDAKGQDGDWLRCTHCGREQEISPVCKWCNYVFARYFCPECRIFVNGSLEPFHCDKCGVCRAGGRENYFHCSVCNICLEKSLYNKHECSENSGRDLCGICFEELFSGYVLLPCGHKLHRKCAERLVSRGSLECPFCRKPIFPEDREEGDANKIESHGMFMRFFHSIISWWVNSNQNGNGARQLPVRYSHRPRESIV